MEEEVDPKVGQLLLGRYRIIRKFGEGGMGAVYEAKHELIGRKLAIKCLHPQFMSNAEVVERFQREANAATAVGNEHIIEVTDVGSFDDGSPFMVMEFLDGVEFGDLLEKEGSLPISRLVHIVTQTCEALAAAHARGIVHRDMKPENIFLIPRGGDDDFVKVLDFGISKMKEHSESLDGSGSLTKTGMALGTPYYMPPEQAQGVKDIDARADVYAVGVILYQGLAGRLPFDAESYPALMVKIMTELPPPMKQYRGDIPDELEQIVYKAMAKDRDERFQSVEDLALALQPFAALNLTPAMLASMRAPQVVETTPFAWSETVEKPAPGQSEAPSAASRSARNMIMGAGALAALGVATLFFTLGRGTGETTPAAAGLSVPEVPPQQAGAPVAPTPVAPIAQPLPSGIAVPPKPTEVVVQISATPAKARIFIDDLEFPNPMDAYRPRSLNPVRIRVELPGYRTIEQLAIFDQNRVVSFELEKGTGVKRLAALQSGSGARPSRNIAAKPRRPSEATVVKKLEPVVKPKPAVKKPPEVYKGPSGKIRDEF